MKAIKKDRYKLITALIIFAFFLSLSVPVLAQGNFGDYLFTNRKSYVISEINTLADIDSNGDMYIRQKWVFDDSFAEGTEHYIVFDKNSLNEVSMKDFQVRQNGRALREVPWNVDASFSQKAGKFGLNETSNSWELCFGIGENIPNNSFEVSYVVEDAIERTEDDTWFLHWKFINDQLSDPVGKVRLEVSFPTRVKKIYGFGYQGIVAMSAHRDNTVVYENGPDQPLRENNQVIALIELEGPYTYYRDRDQTRKEVYKEAFKNSSYKLSEIDNKNLLLDEYQVLDEIEKGQSNTNFSVEDTSSKLPTIFMGAFLIIAAIVGVVLFIFSKFGIKTGLTRSEKKDSYFRDKVSTPPNQMLPLLKEEYLTRMSHLILYYFVKWHNEGIIDVRKEVTQTFFKKEKEVDTIYFNDVIPEMDHMEREFYKFFLIHAEIDSQTNEKMLNSEILKDIDYSSLNTNYNEYTDSDEAYDLIADFFAPNNKGKKVLNEEGKSQLLQYYGMRNFLKDFTLMDEREIQEVKLWSYHLELAALLGLAEKVQKQLELHPEAYADTVNVMDLSTTTMILSSYGAASSSSSSSGSGGFSSSGGGGGFSGGGSGGGTR
ncbi:MAG: DUF2207 domain-containing protein [Bacillota bacterium]|nr:DUF2207 domain-containing protein [Bacillota bacterium]